MKIKSSKRGLTFSLEETNQIKIGSKYRYVIDQKNNKILIIPTPEGHLKVSKKKVGKKEKPLFDIRNEEIKNIVSESQFLEIEIKEEEIIVHVVKETARICSFKKRQQFKRTKKSFVIPRSMLKMVAGEEYYQQCFSEEFLNTATLYTESHTKTTQIKKDLKDVFSVISLFSGAGMLDYPFSLDSHFSIDYAIDYDASACASYRENIGNHIVHGNICDIKADTLPTADLIIGGPSCKAFSNANRSETRLDSHPDVDLVDEYIRMVKGVLPKVFVLENVPEFLTANKQEYVNRLYKKLGDFYEISVKKIQDSDVGGYTTRVRAIVIGSRIGKITLPDMKLLPHKTVREALAKVTPHWYNYHDVTIPKPQTLERMKLVPQGGNFKNIPELAHLDSHSCRYKRLHMDELSPTIINWRKAIITHPTEHRILSVAEASALSGFDSRFKFLGTLAEKQQQCGNGVPFKIGEIIKNQVKKALMLHQKQRMVFE